MAKKLKNLTVLLMVLAGLTVSAQDIELKIGSLTVAPSAFDSARCVQIPVIINDLGTAGGGDGFELNNVTVTIEITGDTGIINGGLAQQLFIPNGYTSGDTTGIANPFQDLTTTTLLGDPNPDCGAGGFNQATQGSGPELSFPTSSENINRFVKTDADGSASNAMKQMFISVANPLGAMGTTTPGQDVLVGVLEIPIIANPGTAQLILRAVPNTELAAANFYNYDDATRADIDGDLVLPGNATVNIFEAVDCTGAVANGGNGASANPEVNFADPALGGNGGTLAFTFTHPATVDQITITDGGAFTRTIAADASGTTTLTIDSVTDGSPAATDATTNYSITYEVEFPGGSGNFAGGSACTVSATWADPVVDLTANPTAPEPGDQVDFSFVITNGAVSGGNIATLTLPGGGTVDIDTTGGALAGNVYTMTNKYTIAAIDPATQAGAYVAMVSGSAGTTAGDDTVTIGFECPDAADFPSSSAGVSGNSDVFVGDLININADLSPTPNLDFEVFYPSHNGSAPETGLTAATNIAATAGNDTFYVRVRGFGDVGGGTFASCYFPNAAGTGIVENPAANATGFWYAFNVAWAPAFCADEVNAQLQLGAGSVPPFDVGQNINVELVGLTGGSADTAKELNIAGAVINGVNMSQSAPGLWTATVPAGIGMTVSVTGVDGNTANCPQVFLTVDDFNCTVFDPTINAILGQNVSFYGTDGCNFDLFASTSGSLTSVAGMTPVDSTLISNDRGDGFGLGTFTNHTVEPDMFYYVAVSGDATGFIQARTNIASVPTLGEWGMIAFVVLLMAAALVMMRRNRMA